MSTDNRVVVKTTNFNNRLIQGERLPATREEALSCGSDYFYPMEPCSGGHPYPRIYLDTGRCHECAKEAAAKRLASKETNLKKKLDDKLYDRELRNLGNWTY